jgi:hypothetical protein
VIAPRSRLVDMPKPVGFSKKDGGRNVQAGR